MQLSPSWRRSRRLAQGGCGSVCVPLEVLDPERTHVLPGAFRVTFMTEYGEFDRFVEGDEPIANPGGNKATIHETAFFVDYGASSRATVSLLLPYIRKIQQTNRFGERIAKGLGDVTIFGRYEVLYSNLGRGPSVSVGLGLKLPTGSISAQAGNVGLGRQIRRQRDHRRRSFGRGFIDAGGPERIVDLGHHVTHRVSFPFLLNSAYRGCASSHSRARRCASASCSRVI